MTLPAGTPILLAASPHACSVLKNAFQCVRWLKRSHGCRKMQNGLVCSLVDVLDYSSHVVQERSHMRSDTNSKLQALSASHWRQVSTSRTILCRLVDN